MPRTDRDSNSKGLTATATLKVLGAFSGHSRKLPNHERRRSMTSYTIARDSYLHRRGSNGYQPVQECPPLRRERCLTPPPFGKAILQPSQFNAQTQSPLFKLPEELLILIYEEVIGSNLFHIVRRTNQLQLGHTVCKSNLPRSQEDCKENECRGLKIPTGLHVKSGPGNGGLIQLLQTCRKAYIDAAKVLYSFNIFDFDCMETLISFSNAVVPARFDSIVSLQLDFRFSLSQYFSEATPQNDLARWERTWRIIGSMKSLQFLWVRIAWPKPEITVREERRFMEPLCQVGVLNCFEVSLPPVIGQEYARGKEENWVFLRRKR